MDIREFALKMIENNPNVKNNPNSKELIEIIRSNNQERGVQVARNYCQSMGCSEDDAVSKAKGFFGL